MRHGGRVGAVAPRRSTRVTTDVLLRRSDVANGGDLDGPIWLGSISACQACRRLDWTGCLRGAVLGRKKQRPPLNPGQPCGDSGLPTALGGRRRGAVHGYAAGTRPHGHGRTSGAGGTARWACPPLSTAQPLRGRKGVYFQVDRSGRLTRRRQICHEFAANAGPPCLSGAMPCRFASVVRLGAELALGGAAGHAASGKVRKTACPRRISRRRRPRWYTSGQSLTRSSVPFT